MTDKFPDISQNLGNLMKEAQKMQERMKQAQDDLIKLEVKGQAGSGLVIVVMNGRHEVLSVTIKPSLMDEDVEMLQDLLMAAYNDASRKVEEASRQQINKLTSGLNIPAEFMKNKEGDKE